MRGATLFAGLLARFALAVPGPFVQEEKRQTPGCKFDSAKTPECWDGVFNLNSNYYDEGPDTGKVREYNFTLTNFKTGPDGFEKMVLAINEQIPGPTIYADWGDTVVVHVTNKLDIPEGTSIHFHGIRQLNTNAHDGVVAITQCPTAPGETITYRWKASQYGTSWYHSHYALQPWDGVFGGIVINGPASANYTEDLGVVTLGDWFHNTTEELYPIAKTGRVPPPQNGLVNGTNKFQDGGKYFVANKKMTKGERYRIRLINHAMDMDFKVVLDGHEFEVIATDFVPIKPFTTKVLPIGIGQRLDVIVQANADVGNYWLHAVPRCAGGGNSLTGIKGIFRYENAPESEPTGPEPTIGDGGVNDCFDFPVEKLVPIVSLEAGGADRSETFTPGFNGQVWRLGQQSFLTNWSDPTVSQVLSGKTDWTAPQTVVKLDEAKKWVYFIINSNVGTHPIHLHGHDFWILSQGTGGAFDPAKHPIQTKDAPRRDVAMLPGNGHLVIGFPTDNPGVWLMHCHIGWHASLGFALQLVERFSEIPKTTDMNQQFLDQQCIPWKKYAAEHNITQPDSGI